MNLSTADTPQFHHDVCRTSQKGWEPCLEKCNLEKQGQIEAELFSKWQHSWFTPMNGSKMATKIIPSSSGFPNAIPKSAFMRSNSNEICSYPEHRGNLLLLQITFQRLIQLVYRPITRPASWTLPECPVFVLFF